MSEINELRLRIHAEKKALEARLAKLRADGTATANTAAETIETELRELEGTLRDGWDKLTDAAAHKLNDWLEKHKKST
tara:strand:- start:15776 stop:16009 length:234 start_codon:yes stop_codon:yes gene_type:complete